MLDTITCPSGLTGRIRGMKVSEERVLADKRLARCWGRGDAGLTGRLVWVRRLLDPMSYGVAVDADDVSIGSYHSCVLRSGRSMNCMGRNDAGQLGTGDVIWHSISWVVAPMGASHPTALAVGDSHTCAVFPAVGGSMVSCWGDHSVGQLGGRSGAGTLVPRTVGGIEPSVATLEAGANHTCTIVAGESRRNQVRCWGDNSFLQCGESAARPTENPPSVEGTVGAEQVTAGNSHSCALLAAGSVVCWGQNRRGQLGSSRFVGDQSAVAVTVNGL